MVNNSASSELFAPREWAAALDFDPSHEESDIIIRTMLASTAVCVFRLLTMFMAGSSFRPLLSAAPEHSYKRTGPGDRPVEPTGSCARHRENPTSWRRHACRHTR